MKVKLIAKPDPINIISKPDRFNFKGLAWGNCYEIKHITDNTLKQVIDILLFQRETWNLFLKNNAEIDKDIAIESSFLTEDEGVLEGQEKRALLHHKYFERNPEIVSKAKEYAEKNKLLYCEICNFDFSKKYPNLGNGFIECHHKKPISCGERVTRMEDLALVCSNCHRMLHRKYQSGFLSIEELKKIVNKGGK